MIIETWMIWVGVYAYFTICSFIVELTASIDSNYSLITRILGASVMCIAWPIWIGTKLLALIRAL